MNDDFKNYIQLLIDNKDKITHLPERDIHNLLDYITNLQKTIDFQDKWLEYYKNFISENNIKDYKSRCEKATNELFELKDMIYKPETRDENIPIQQKITSIIKQLNGRSDE